MAEWRLLRRWSERELRTRLVGLSQLPLNFEETHPKRMEHPAWEVHGSRSVIAREDPGPPEPEGPFERARLGLVEYRFSDPSIVEAHFAPDGPLLGRRMLLELKPLVLRYLCGVVVGAVRNRRDEERTLFGYRYDTLSGHIERGSEWFLLEKDHATGDVHFRVEATWQKGDFPNLWSRVGFALLGQRYQRAWHRRAHRRLSRIAHGLDASRLRGGPGGSRRLEDVSEVDFVGPATDPLPVWSEVEDDEVRVARASMDEEEPQEAGHDR